MKKKEEKQKKYSIDNVNLPLFSALEKKDYKSLVACFAFEIKDFYTKQQDTTKKVPP